ncbi:MAG: thioesterase family protein [Baekduia sp.]
MSLDRMLQEARDGENVVVDDGWDQGRATFGGVVGGILLARAESVAGDPARELRSAMVSFVAPVDPGEVEVGAEVLRAGKGVTQIHATLRQQGAVAGAMLASFGLERSSVLDWESPDAAAPSLTAASAIDPLPYVSGVTPGFFGHVEMRIAEGTHPFAGAQTPDLAGWMRFTEPPAEFTTAHLLTLTDCWPPSVLSMLSGPGAASTLSWTFEPVAPSPPGGDDPRAQWQYEVLTDRCSAGYAHTHARIWDEHGTLRALSRQTIAVFS